MLLLLVVAAAACGVVQAAPSFVLNGRIAELGEFPFAAWLGSCSASILDSRTILTAGHCVCRRNPTSILLGAVNGRRPEEGSKRVELDRDGRVIHPRYTRCGTIGKDDLAILKTAEPIEFDDRIKPIQLRDSATTVGESITVSGYGQDENRRSGVLRTATNTVVTCSRFVGSVCQKMTPNSPYYGDSGGPLFTGSADAAQQVGVVSGGDFSNNEAIYGNVFDNLEWIRENME